MGRKKKTKQAKSQIAYPPVPTRKWIPPDDRRKVRIPKAAPYPPQLTSKLTVSTLKKIWHAYDIIHDCAVLLGHFSQTHKRYTYLTNGFQGAANCVMAVLFSKLVECPYWNAYMLDTILNWGDRYYTECRKQYKLKEHLRVADLQRELYIFKHKIFINFKGDKMKVLLYHDSNPRDYLENAIREFFCNFDSGVISTVGPPNRHFAVWKLGPAYFLFDPTDHDKMCWPWKGVLGLGFCFLVRFTNTDKLVEVIQRNLNSPLSNMEMEIYPIEIERIVSINTDFPDCLADANLEAIEPKLAKLNRNESVIIKKQPRDSIETAPEVVLPDEDQDEEAPAEGAPVIEDEEEVGRPRAGKRRVLIEKPRVSSITYFNYVIPDRIGILLAETHQDDPDFDKCPGKQGISNAVAALTMLRQLKAKYWTTRVLTQVLRLGFRICRESKRVLRPRDTEYTLKNITKRIELNEKNYTPHITHIGAVGRLQSTDEAMLELLPAMKEVLSECDTLVVQGPLIVAIWKEDGYFYMFDPNERDPNGFAIVKEIRVGSAMETVDYIGGCACLTWFSDLKDLIEMYMVNVARDSKRDPFIISNVEIKDYIPLPENWCFFEAIDEDRWILRGNFSQSDRKFERSSRNTQCTANCVMALAYAHAIPLAQWTAETMDTILMCGNDYYINCVEELKRKNKFVSYMLMLVELMPEFIADNKLAVIDINECLVNGFITIRDEIKNTLNLKKGLVEFFKENDFGVLTCRGVSIAVFKKGEGFFYFDSHDRDDLGFCKPHGKACVQRFVSTDKMAEVIMGNLGPGVFHAIYNLSRIDVFLYEPPPPDAPKDEDDDDEEILPDDDDAIGFNLRDKFDVDMAAYNYEKITKKRAILQSKFHQGSKFFGTNAGKQTVPNLISAIATSRVFDPRHWNKERLDEVLMRGNELYDESMDNYYKEQAKRNIQEQEDEDENDDITTENVVTEFKIGINKFNVTFEPLADDAMDLDCSSIKEILTSVLKEDPTDVNDFKEVYIHTDMMDVVVWKHDGLYYLFDPSARNARGEVFGKEEWSEYEAVLEEEEYEYEDDTENDEELLTIAFEEEEEEPPAKVLTSEAVASYLEQEWKEIGEQDGEDEEVIPKHSQEYWDDLEATTGRACVIWFSKLKLLIKHLVGNNPPKLREGFTFKITRILLNNEPDIKETFDPALGTKEDEISGDWRNFKEITYGQWILRGTMHQRNEMFPESNRGKQADANALLSVAFAALYGLSQFTKTTVDSILKYGDRLYTHTKKLRRRELEGLESAMLSAAEIDEVMKYDRYTLEKLVKNICLGDDNIFMVVDEVPITGEVHAEDLEELLDVKRALDLFFGNSANQYAILSAKGNTVGLWKIRDFYYMFDPRERGPHGHGFEQGVACITRFMEVGPIAQLFVKNLPKMGKNFFVLFGVTAMLGTCNKPILMESKRVDDPLKVTGFAPVARGKMIIRGTLHQDLPMFGRGTNAQCSTIALVALAMTLIHSTEYWTKLIVDEIVQIGDKIYGELLEKCDFDFNPWEEKLTVSMSPKDFKVGKIKVNCEVRYTEQSGVIDCKSAIMQNLRQGIEHFFDENSYGILQTDFLTVAIWEPEDSGDTNYLYMLDPNQRSQTGQPTTESGCGCCMKFCGAKIMADHVISLVEHDREGQFLITPIEIVIERDGRCKKTKRYGIDKLLDTSVDQSKNKWLGRREFYKIPNTDMEILRGSRSQASKYYPDNSRGYQDIPNCIVSYVMDKLIPLRRWNCKTIDMILDVGEQLYKDSYMVYDPRDKKLRMETLVRDVLIRDIRVTVSVGAPIIAAQFHVKALYEALDACFNLKPFCIVMVDQSAVAIFKKEEIFYLFDPMDLDLNGNRAENGSAAVLRFEDINVMINQLMANFLSHGHKIDRFHVIIVGIKELMKVAFKFEHAPQQIRPQNKCICDKSMYGHLKKSTKSKLASIIAEHEPKVSTPA